MPTASSPGQNSRACASLTTVTGAARAPCSGPKPRPRTIEMPSARKTSVVALTRYGVESSPAEFGRPSTSSDHWVVLPLSGSDAVAATARTLGSARIRSTARS